MIDAAPERRRVCPKRTRARGEASDWPRQLSGCIMDGESGMLEGQALTFRRERKNGPIPVEVRSLRPCRQALQHCFSQRGCNNGGTFAAHGEWREGGRREGEEATWKAKKDRRKRHEFHRQMAGAVRVTSSSVPAAITLVLPMAPTKLLRVLTRHRLCLEEKGRYSGDGQSRRAI